MWLIKLMTGRSLRLVLGFIIAPISPTLVITLFNSIVQSGEGNIFLFQLGSMLGYTFSIILGIPLYFKYIRRKEHGSYKTLARISFFFTAIAFTVISILLIAQSGVWALLSPTLWAFTLLFAIAVNFAFIVFYIVALMGVEND